MRKIFLLIVATAVIANVGCGIPQSLSHQFNRRSHTASDYDSQMRSLEEDAPYGDL